MMSEMTLLNGTLPSDNRIIPLATGYTKRLAKSKLIQFKLRPNL